MYKKFSYFIATMFGVGFSPLAPGTAGSLATLPFAFLLSYFYGIWGIAIASILVFIFGTIATKEVLKYTSHDPSLVVIDETAGQLISFAFVANILIGRLDNKVWIIYGIGFVLFRIFDIFKPWPVGWADKKIESEWGVMLDDVFAGIYAGVILYLITRYFPWLSNVL